MKAIDLGKISVPTDQYASQGNAVLGIRGSGKSYTATYVAERLLDAGIPIVAFDPIGIWRFLRVPGIGTGYRVVVAGGEHGDIPLPAHGAAEIMRAAMRDGVSIIFDLYDIALSKGDWRRVVESALKVLLYENKAHGLRHVFLEEAAEFCPQRIQPDQGAVYSAIERLARMGGNAQLGYTLINQRAEEVNKAVLELCDLLILHRQKGRNSLTALGKWLDVAMVKVEIAKEVPALANGEAFIWPAGDAPPVKTKIPAKRTFHPDRKAMQQASAAETKRVDVSAFVATMRTSLEALIEEAAENDPKRLKAELAKLRKSAVSAVPDTAAITEAEKCGYAAAMRAVQPLVDRLVTLGGAITETIGGFQEDLQRLVAATPSPASHARVVHVVRAQASQRAPGAHVPPKVQEQRKAAGDAGSGIVDRAQRAFLTALAQQGRALTRNQVAIFAGYSATSRHVDNTLAVLRSKGFAQGGREGIEITPAGRETLGNYDRLPTGEALRAYWTRELDKASGEFLKVLCDAYPGSLSRNQVAELAGYSITSRHVDNCLAQLRSRELAAGGRAAITASPNLFD